MCDETRIDRRKFLGFAGFAGGALSLEPKAGSAQEPTERSVIWNSNFDPESLDPKWNPRALPEKGETIHEFDIDLVIAEHEIVPRIVFHAYAYNGVVPGPELRVREGEWIKVNFTNKTHDLHTIHWHGIDLACEMDGVPLGTQYPVMYNQTFQYLFRAQPSGTHWYHCHNMTPLHIQAGMYGPLIVEPINDPVLQAFPYSRDYTLVLSEIDTDYVRDQMNAMLQMGEVMDYMNGSPTLMKEMSGKMMGWFVNKEAFVKAVKDGWTPPYDPSIAGPPRLPNPNFFMINGKSYPMTEPIMIKSGEFIRVRFINAGAATRFMHLHGHDFWVVCEDGAPLASPIRHNTVAVHPSNTVDIIIHGTNPGMWHFHDHSEISDTNNGSFPGGMMTMLMYEDAAKYGVHVPDIVAVNS